MKTNLILGIVAAIAVIGGGGYYVMNMSESAEGGDSNAESAEAGAFQGSMTALMERGGNWKCTVDAEASTGAGQAVSSGVVYVSGDKVRADFTSTVEGYGNVDSHMIADGTNVYTWTSMMAQGIKTRMTAMGSGGAQTSGQGFDANQSYSYDCDMTTADASLFVVPKSVTFMDLNF